MQKHSVLDTVIENAHAMQRGLGKTDRANLDEYFQGIRDIETRLNKDEQWIGVPPAPAPLPEPKPGLAGREETKLIYDIMVAVKEADGTRLFDHVALAYGSNLRTEHSLDNCPTLLTGGGAGIKLGHNIVVSKDTPLCNARLTLLHGIGVEAERHGDSTGVIKELIA